MGRVQAAVAVREEDKERGLEGAEAREGLAPVGCQRCPLTSGAAWVRRNGLLRCLLLENGSCGRLVDSHGVTEVLFRREHSAAGRTVR